VTDVLRHTTPDAVLHLHGVYTEPGSVVLGLASYLQVRDDAHASTVLRSLAQGRTLLFVGCGDTVSDPNFARLIQWAKAALDDVAPHHFLLCRQSERRAFQNKLRQAPWLQPLAYGDDYADLLPFLQSLAPAPRPAAVPVAPQTPAAKPIHLPSHSLGQLFLGREAQLIQLHTHLGARPSGSHAPAVLAVLHGLGGMGKTRLALEYAWGHADTYGALLLVPSTRPTKPASGQCAGGASRLAADPRQRRQRSRRCGRRSPATPACWRPPDRHQPHQPVERRHPDPGGGEAPR
jgi:hypothetical protein